MPGHFSASETLAAVRNKDQWKLSVNDTSYPIAVTLIMPGWTDSKNPDFNIALYDDRGRKVASTRTSARQDTLQFVPSRTGDYTVEISSVSGSGPYFFDVSAGANTLTLLSDDDPGAVHDVAVSQIAVAPSVAPGTTDVGVVVDNLGTQSETTTVTLSDLTDPSTVVTSAQSVTVSAGNSRTVPFTWDTTSSSLDAHTLEAEARSVPGETDTNNNIKQTTVVVAEVQGTLSASVMTGTAYSIGDTAVIAVKVTKAGTSNPVDGASVTVDVTTGSGKVYTNSAVTDAAGQAALNFRIKKPDGTGTYGVDVTATKAGYDNGTASTTFTVS
ncbi:MAG: hypothetical protein ACM3L6_03980 [Deltaproteobacteria bacterium]